MTPVSERKSEMHELFRTVAEAVTLPPQCALRHQLYLICCTAYVASCTSPRSQGLEFTPRVAPVSSLPLFTCATAARAPVVLVNRSSVMASSSKTGVRARSV